MIPSFTKVQSKLLKNFPKFLKVRNFKRFSSKSFENPEVQTVKPIRNVAHFQPIRTLTKLLHNFNYCHWLKNGPHSEHVWATGHSLQFGISLKSVRGVLKIFQKIKVFSKFTQNFHGLTFHKHPEMFSMIVSQLLNNSSKLLKPAIQYSRTWRIDGQNYFFGE